jgi:hypothetical protein
MQCSEADCRLPLQRLYPNGPTLFLLLAKPQKFSRPKMPRFPGDKWLLRISKQFLPSDNCTMDGANFMEIFPGSVHLLCIPRSGKRNITQSHYFSGFFFQEMQIYQDIDSIGISSFIPFLVITVADHHRGILPHCGSLWPPSCIDA